MKTRIKQLIVNKNLTSASFADKIGVQRSSISHILTGRNNPSLDFFQKLLKVFPDINSEWLLTGEGTMLKTDNKMQLPNVNKENLQSNLFDTNINKLNVTNVNYEKTATKEIKKSKIVKKRTIKIVNFYDDNTFEEFFPVQ